MEQPHHKPRRTAMWILIALGGLLLLAVIGFIYSFGFELGSIKKPLVPTPAWDEAKYRSPKNPYRHYETAMRLLTQYDADILMEYYQQTVPGVLSAGEQPVSKRELEISLANIAPAIDEFMEGAKLSVDDFQFAQKRASASTPFPELGHLRTLARAVLADANYKVNQGKVRESLEKSLAPIDMGNGISRASVGQLGALFGYSIKVMAYRTIQTTIGKQGPSADDYRMVAKRLEKADAERLPLSKIMENEYIFTRSMLIEILHGIGPKESMQMGFQSGSSSERAFAYLIVPGMKTRVVRNFDYAWSAMLSYSDEPYPAAMAFNATQLISSLDPVNQQFIQDPKGLFRKNAEDLALSRGIMFMAALEAFRLEKGQYPNTLKDLVAGGYILKAPVDPFTDSKPFKYIKTGNKYLLYSIGPDLSDEGGSAVIPYSKIDAADRGDIVFSPGLNIWHKPQSITQPGGRGGPGTSGSAARRGKLRGR